MGVLKVWDPVSGTYVDVVGKGVAQSATDHGLLTGLSDPDHQIGSVQGLQAALDGKADDDHVHATSSSVRRFALENPATTTPSTGEISIATTTGQGRTFRVSKTDADGVGYNLAPLLPGDGITVTDDPATPPVTGFSRYTVTSDVTDAGTFWQFDATRTDTSGTTTPPANGTIVRFIPTMSGGGTGDGIPASLFDAHTILAATADNTPAAVTVAEQRLVGRVTGGNIDDLDATAVKTLLALTAADVGASPSTQTINAQTGTTYTVAAGDVDKLVTLSNTGAITVTLPQDSDVTFAVGRRVDFVVINTGMVTFVAGTGATVNGTPSLVSRAQWSAVSLIKRAANTWVAVGDLAT